MNYYDFLEDACFIPICAVNRYLNDGTNVTLVGMYKDNNWLLQVFSVGSHRVVVACRISRWVGMVEDMGIYTDHYIIDSIVAHKGFYKNPLLEFLQAHDVFGYNACQTAFKDGNEQAKHHIDEDKEKRRQLFLELRKEFGE